MSHSHRSFFDAFSLFLHRPPQAPSKVIGFSAERRGFLHGTLNETSLF